MTCDGRMAARRGAAAGGSRHSRRGELTMYRYVSIIPPSRWDTSSDTDRLIAHLRNLPRLRQVNAMSFGSAPGHPWVDVTLLNASGPDSWASDGTFSPRFNRVEMVCPCEEPPQWYDALAAEIAAFLRWRVVVEEDR